MTPFSEGDKQHSDWKQTNNRVRYHAVSRNDLSGLSIKGWDAVAI